MDNSFEDAETAPELTDRSLLRRFQEGTTDAATLLYFRYAEKLRNLASARIGNDLAPRLDADDIVQSVFRTFFRRAALGQFEVPVGEDLWKLFLVIALNKVRATANFHRAQKRNVGRTPSIETVMEPAGESPDAAVILNMVIEEMLGQLTPVQREIIEFRIHGYEVKQIATGINCSVRTVERTLQNFRLKLKTVLGDTRNE